MFNFSDDPICHWSGWYELLRSSKQATDANPHAKVLGGRFHGRKIPLFRQDMP